VKHDAAGGVAAAGRQIGELLRIGRAQVRLVPVVAANLVVLGDVQLAFEKREAVRLVQPWSTVTVLSALPRVSNPAKQPLCLTASLTSSTPPGVKIIMRAPSTSWAKPKCEILAALSVARDRTAFFRRKQIRHEPATPTREKTTRTTVVN